VREQVYGAPTLDEPTAYETKEIGVEFCETLFAVCDSLGICRFVCQGWNSPKLLGYEHFAELVRPAVGLETDSGELRAAGRRIVDLERLINQREGLGRADDTLPSRYFEDPMPGGNTKGHRIDRAQFGELLTRYYRRRGWDEEGRLAPDRVAELNAACASIPTQFERTPS
jgi:aldehyde:ferredoxin oxidoreductase